MTYMVFVDDFAAWSAPSLPGAQKLARGYMSSGMSLKIVDYELSGSRVWVYDYDRSTWFERGAAERAIPEG